MAEPLARLRAVPTANGPLNLEIQRGDIVQLAGPNGCGKTTLLRALAGLATPWASKVGSEVGIASTQIPAQDLNAVLMFQDPRDGLVGLTVRGEFDLRGRPPPPEVATLLDRDVATLSSGEARRVAQAVATSADRPILLLDEPVEGLDGERRADLADAIVRYAKRGAVVFADHSGALSHLATRTLHLGPVHAPNLGSMPIPSARHVLTWPGAQKVPGRPGLRLPALRVASGFHVVTGPNGSGKSTLLLALAGLLGVGATLNGHPAQGRLALPQARHQLWGEQVGQHLEGCDPAMVDLLGAVPFAKRSPLALSGGETQRAALAATLGRPSQLYLLDEPEAHLDGAGRIALVAAIRCRVEEGAIVLAATHDVELVRLAGHRIEVAL
ncbi:MAG: ATP-binding cassette domain-containing protein [Candidatus Thermoplasmatota archaeon]